MTVITRPVGLGDIQLHHLSDERIGVLWQEKIDGTYTGKDVFEWSATLVLYDQLENELDRYACTCTSDGYIYADIPSSDLNAETYFRNTVGMWRIYGTYENQTELIGAGNFKVI